VHRASVATPRQGCGAGADKHQTVLNQWIPRRLDDRRLRSLARPKLELREPPPEPPLFGGARRPVDSERVTLLAQPKGGLPCAPGNCGRGQGGSEPCGGSGGLVEPQGTEHSQPPERPRAQSAGPGRRDVDFARLAALAKPPSRRAWQKDWEPGSRMALLGSFNT